MAATTLRYLDQIGLSLRPASVTSADGVLRGFKRESERDYHDAPTKVLIFNGDIPTPDGPAAELSRTEASLSSDTNCRRVSPVTCCPVGVRNLGGTPVEPIH
jgi:hypothetical protein